MGTLYEGDGGTIGTPWSLCEGDGVALGTPYDGDGATMCIHEDDGETSGPCQDDSNSSHAVVDVDMESS